MFELIRRPIPACGAFCSSARNACVPRRCTAGLGLLLALGFALLTGCVSRQRLRVTPPNAILPLDQSLAFAAATEVRKPGLSIAGPIVWTARNVTEHSQARISPDGTFTARLPGKYRITAQSGHYKARVMLQVPDGMTRDPKAKPVQTTPNISSRGGGGIPPVLPRPPITGPGWQDSSFTRAFALENRRGRDLLRPRTAGQRLPGGLRLNRYDREIDGGTGNGNYLLTVPLLSLEGRGRNVSLNMSYNSQLWTRVDDQTVVYDHDHGWPAPGWSLGFGKVVRMGSYGVALEDPDGTLHPFGGAVNTYRLGYTDFVSHTADGTLLQCSFQLFVVNLPLVPQQAVLLKGSVQYPDGTTVQYGAPSEDAIYPTRITDANGNYLTISYIDDAGPRINSIIDTLGRAVEFYYDSNGRLTSVTAPAMGAGKRILATLHYRQHNLRYGFAPPLKGVGPGQVWLLDAIYSPATQTGYWFGDEDSYSAYGMIAKVSQRRGMSVSRGNVTNPGLVSVEKKYNYPAQPDSTLTDAPTYTQMLTTWAGMDSPDPAKTTYSVSTAGDFRNISTTYPDGTVVSQQLFNHPGQYDDGLVHQLSLSDPTGKVLQTTITDWELGDFDSPRVTRVQVTDELNQTTTTTYGYNAGAPVKTDQLTDVAQLDYDGSVLRTTHTDFVTDANYFRILNLPLAVTQRDGNDQVLSLTKYEYDSSAGKPSNTPRVVSHDEAYNPYAPKYWVPPDNYLDCTDPDPPAKPTCTKVHEDGYWDSVYKPGTDYRGNITKITRYANAANQTGAIADSFDYDMDGNVVARRPSCCEVTSFDYKLDTQYAYPATVSRGSPDLSATTARLASSAVYDFNTGLPLKRTDANSLTTIFSYDGALRPASITLATSAASIYFYNDSDMSMTSVVRSSANANLAETVTRLNGLGLVKQVESAAPEGGWNAYASQYDALARVVKQSPPFRLGQQPLWRQVSYDSLGRTTSLVQADGGKTQRLYNEANQPTAASGNKGQTTRIVDPAGRERWLRNDALGRLAEVVEPGAKGDGTLTWNNGVNNIETAYQYDALGRLLKTLQGPQRQERDFRYDSLGRLIAQRLPEKSATLTDSGAYDPTKGSWSDVYTYDQRSNLTSHMDARGVVAAYDYGIDPFSRLQGVSYTNTLGDKDLIPAPTVVYQYVTNGDLRRLSQIKQQYSSGEVFTSETFSYDSLGRIASDSVGFGNGTLPLQIDYQYDSLNQVVKKTYPAEYENGAQARRIVDYTYGTNGVLADLKIDGVEQASSLRYSPAGQVESVAVGPMGPQQTVDTYTYDPATGLLSSEQVTRGNTSLLKLDYVYSPAWQVTSLTDGQDASGSRSYTYDALGRLASVSGSNTNQPWTQTYDYDVYGNRSKCKVQTQDGQPCADKGVDASGLPRDGLELKFDSATNHVSSSGHVCRADIPDFAYDAAGNQTRALRADGTCLNYRYDSAGRLAEVVDESGKFIERNIYDPNARRLARSATDGLTYYMWDGQQLIAEYRGTGGFQWERSRFYLGNRLLGSSDKRGSGQLVSYFHPDRLGIRLITNGADASSLEQATLPFGALVPNKYPNPVNPLFTTYDRSSATGLDYAINRHYDAQQRFLQPDPLGMAAANRTNPQSLNLYSYVAGDPINRSDPTGLNTLTDLISVGTGLAGTVVGFVAAGPVGAAAGAFLGGFSAGVTLGAMQMPSISLPANYNPNTPSAGTPGPDQFGAPSPAGTGTPSAGTPDAGGSPSNTSDAGTSPSPTGSDTGGVVSGGPDAGTPDAGPPAADAPSAGTPDAGGPSSGGVCDSKTGSSACPKTN